MESERNSMNRTGHDSVEAAFEVLPVIDSSSLFHRKNEVLIKHHHTIYRLRITRSGKLILNK